MKNLANLPTFYWVSLDDSTDRQEFMFRQFSKYKIKNRKVSSIDGRPENFLEKINVEGRLIGSLQKEVLASALSHLTSLYHWYTETDEDIGFFGEDDLDLSTAYYWNFTWDELIDSLPDNWKAVQLSLKREQESPITESKMLLNERTHLNWCAASYILKRNYVKTILDNYMIDLTNFKLNIPRTGFFPGTDKEGEYYPFIENILFLTGNDSEIYTLPIFTEFSQFPSTNRLFLLRESRDSDRRDSSEFIVNWWKFKGQFFNLDHFITNGDN